MHANLLELISSLESHYDAAMKELETGASYVNMGIMKEITTHVEDLKLTIDLAKESGNIYTIEADLLHMESGEDLS